MGFHEVKLFSHSQIIITNDLIGIFTHLKLVSHWRDPQPQVIKIIQI